LANSANTSLVSNYIFSLLIKALVLLPVAFRTESS